VDAVQSDERDETFIRKGTFRDRITGDAFQPDDNSPDHERRLSKTGSGDNFFDASTCVGAAVEVKLYVHRSIWGTRKLEV